MSVDMNRHAVTALVFACLGWIALPIVGQIISRIYLWRADRLWQGAPALGGRGVADAARSVLAIWCLLFVLLIIAVIAFAAAAGWRSAGN